MESKCIYDKLIFVGSGILALDCAMIAMERTTPLVVWEYRLTESTVLEKRCQKEGISYQSFDKKELHAALLQEEAKCLVVSAANSYLFPADVLAKKNLTVINWHNALLPNHKGRNAESWCIYEGDQVTGITWHLVNTGVDQGDVLIQGELPIEEKDSALNLYRKQCKMGADLFREILSELMAGTRKASRQKEGKSTLHYSWDIPAGGWLDLQWNMEQMCRFVRAMDYGALALLGPMHVEYAGQKFRFTRYKLVDDDQNTDKNIAWEERNLTISQGGKKLILRDLVEEEMQG